MAIQLKGSNTSKVIPAVNELEERELAVNTKDGKLFTKTPEGTIVEIGGDNISTGLATKTPTGGTHSGHRYINNTDASDFISLGADATDLTYSSGSNPGSGSIGASGAGSFTAGIDATATGSNSFALGYNSNSQGDNSFTIGSGTTTKNLSFNIGSSNTIGGSVGTLGSFTLGTNNNIVGDASVAIGVGNNIPYNDSILLGTNNESLLNKSYALGYSLQTTNVAGNVVLGQFNSPTGGKSLIIGNGSDSTNRSNILELDSGTGVLSLPQLNSTGNIQSNYDVVTLGYLENYSNIVRTVNGYSGNVSLTAADINEQTGVDRLWFTQTERDQITSNSNAINTKEPLLPDADIANKVLVVTDASARTWEWKNIDASNISMSIGDLIDVDAIQSEDANKFLKVNGAGNAVNYSDISRTDVDLLQSGFSTTDPQSGKTFELSDDPYYWGINNETFNLIDNLNTLTDISDTFSDGDVLVLKFTVVDHSTGDVTQSYEVDSAVNTPYSNTTSGLTSTDVQSAIDELNTSVTTNSTDIDSLQGYILGSGDTSSRPSTTLSGAQYFDTDLVKPIWWDNTGSQWVDATGTAV